MSDTLALASSPLRPQRTIQKILLSTTSRIIGQHEEADVLLMPAFPNFQDRNASVRMAEGPLSRNAFVLSFESAPVEMRSGAVLPDHSRLGDVLASMMSVLYGKRFDNHGAIETHGLFSLPDTTVFASICNPGLPHNSHAPRANLPVELDIKQVARILTYFRFGHENERFALTFEAAASFYSRALRSCETDPEVAYLHLITAGEILGNYFERNPDDLLDEQMKKTLQAVATGMPKGEKIVRAIRGRLRQIKRRFSMALTELVTAEFFANSEATESFLALDEETFKQRIGAAYDLRSKYVHTGIHFGTWIAPGSRIRAEIQGGHPIVSDKELATALAWAPTFLGLERVIRFALLRFAATHGREVFPNLELEANCA